MFDVFTYREIILNLYESHVNDDTKYIIINNFDSISKTVPHFLIRDNEYVIGYNIDTINGIKYMPVFNHNLGQIKNKMNLEFIINYKEYIIREKNRKINALYTIGFPYELCELIYDYIN
jgi:hypothetical protein